MHSYVPTRLSLALLVVSAVPAAAQALDASGEWGVNLRAPTGTYLLRASIRQEGEKVSGPVSGDVKSTWLRGTVHGDEIKAVCQIEFSGNLISITLTGKLDGNSMKGTADFAGFPGDWTAQRLIKVLNASVLSEKKIGVSGTWRLRVKTAAATSYPMFELKQEGDTVTGRCRASFGEAPVTGTVTGREIAFSFKAATWTADVTISYMGIVNGNSMTGAVRVGEAGVGTWTASRAPLLRSR